MWEVSVVELNGIVQVPYCMIVVVDFTCGEWY